jgi:hypothetical protein
MQVLRASLKPGIWGVIIGGILTMIVGFSWEAGRRVARHANRR